MEMKGVGRNLQERAREYQWKKGSSLFVKGSHLSEEIDYILNLAKAFGKIENAVGTLKLKTIKTFSTEKVRSFC